MPASSRALTRAAPRPILEQCTRHRACAAKLDQWRIYAAERADVHDFLASLTPAQWDEPSLCEGWRIRDVAVHLLVDEPVEQSVSRWPW